MIPVYQRPQLLHLCLKRLFASTLIEACAIVFINDASPDNEVESILSDFCNEHMDKCWIRLMKKENKGIADSVIAGWNILQTLGVSILCLLDSDMLVSQDWIVRMKSIMDTFADKAVFTGFNETLIGRHKAIPNTLVGSCIKKKTIGGCHIMLKSSMWIPELREKINVPKGRGWDWCLVGWCDKNKVNLVCSVPSCVQHVGASGMNSVMGKPTDYALDFFHDEGDGFVFLVALDIIGGKAPEPAVNLSHEDVKTIKKEIESSEKVVGFTTDRVFIEKLDKKLFKLQIIVTGNEGIHVKKDQWLKFIS